MIVWRPAIDDWDRDRFPFSTHLKDWEPLDGWVGHDMDDAAPMYTLELLMSKSSTARMVCLCKWLSKDPTKKYRVEPAEVSEEVIADAAEHVGFANFRLERDGSCYVLHEGQSQS